VPSRSISYGAQAASQLSSFRDFANIVLVAAATSTSLAEFVLNAWEIRNVRGPASGTPIDAIELTIPHGSAPDVVLPTALAICWPAQTGAAADWGEVPARRAALSSSTSSDSTHGEPFLARPINHQSRRSQNTNTLLLTSVSYQVPHSSSAPRSRWRIREMSSTLPAKRHRRIVMSNEARPLARSSLPIIPEPDSSASIATGLAHRVRSATSSRPTPPSVQGLTALTYLIFQPSHELIPSLSPTSSQHRYTIFAAFGPDQLPCFILQVLH